VAEFAERYLKRGMQITVCGSMQVRTYEDSTGQRRWITEVIVDESQFAESKAAYESRMLKNGNGNTPQPNEQNSIPNGFTVVTMNVSEGDMPF
jgi:single-strand DNA-binding protein